MHIGYWWESQKEIYPWEDQDIGGWIILKRVLERYGSCEQGNKTSTSMKYLEIFEQLHNWRLLKKGSAP
jgi:hypothetical protein